MHGPVFSGNMSSTPGDLWWPSPFLRKFQCWPLRIRRWRTCQHWQMLSSKIHPELLEVRQRDWAMYSAILRVTSPSSQYRGFIISKKSWRFRLYSTSCKICIRKTFEPFRLLNLARHVRARIACWSSTIFKITKLQHLQQRFYLQSTSNHHLYTSCQFKKGRHWSETNNEPTCYSSLRGSHVLQIAKT